MKKPRKMASSSNHNTRQWRTSRPRGALICLTIALVVVCQLMASSTRLASGRYLPTRADDTEMEILKDLIRGLLTRSKIQAEQVAGALRASSANPSEWSRANNYHIRRRSMGEAELAQVSSDSGDLEQPIDGQSVSSFLQQRQRLFYGQPMKLDR